MSKFTKNGIRLPDHKQPAAAAPLRQLPSPQTLTLPLLLSDGTPCRAAVAVGDRVRRGSPLGLSQEDDRVLLAAVDGILEEVAERHHPLLGTVAVAVVRVQTVEAPPPITAPAAVSADELIRAVAAADMIDEIDGLPLAAKLQAWQAQTRPLLLVADAMEQQPFGSSAWAAIDEQPQALLDSLATVAQALGMAAYRVALPRSRCRRGSPLAAHRLAVGRRYPWYHEGLTHSMQGTGSMLLCRIGVQACLAARRAVDGYLPTGGMVTVAGDGVGKPQNVWVPYGTAVSELLAACAVSDQAATLVLGDALTGVAAADDTVPVVAGLTCVLALNKAASSPTVACIGCGRCVRACHAHLLPYEIMRRLDAMQYDSLARLLPSLCDGCGACSYVCPAKLPVTAKVLEAREIHGNVLLNWGDGDGV